MKYACRDFRCIRGYIRPDKASLSETPISNLLITRHKTAADLQGTKPAVWLAVRSVSCKPVSPGFLRKFRGKKQGENCPGTGTCLWPYLWQCAGPQFPAGLLFLYGMFLCGTGLRSADHPCIKPQTEPDRRAGFHDRKRWARGTGQDGGQGRAVRGVVPGLAFLAAASQVALQGGPVRHMSIR